MKTVFLEPNKHKGSFISLYLFGIIQIWVLYQQHSFSVLGTVYVLVFFSILYLIGLWINRVLNKPALSIHFWITWSALGMGLMVVPAVLGNALFAKNVLPSYFGQQGLLVGQVTESLPYIFTIASIVVIVVTAIVYLSAGFFYGYRYGLLTTWLENLAVMAAVFTGIISTSIVGNWFFSELLNNVQVEHFFNLTILALFSTVIYELVISQFDFILDIQEQK